jgi:flagellar basal body-associated protein FliL
MNATTGQPDPASTDSGPSTIEIIIGFLALVLALAAVVVGVAQYFQARAAKHQRRQPEPELGQTNIELSTITNHVADTDSVASNAR